MNSSPGLLSILRSALKRLDEESTGPDDAAVQRLKQRILRSLAQLDLSRQSLKAPDVLMLPQTLLPPGQRTPLALVRQPDPGASTNSTGLADSVSVLVTRRPRKPGGKDSGSSGHSSAA